MTRTHAAYYIIPTKQVAADFFHPVLELYPHLSAEYLAAVREPMDLQTLYYLLFEVQ